MLNEFENKKRYFPLENDFFIFANAYKNNTLFMALDCCRETKTFAQIKEV